MTTRINRRILLAYGLPGLPLAVLGLPLYVYLPVFYVEQMGLSLAAVGSVLLLARIFDMATDPLIGMASDHSTGIARRKPWMAVATPLLVISTVMLFMPPSGVGLSWLLAWSMFMSLAWTMVALPYTALGAELSDDYHERSRLAAAREGCVILGTLLAVLVAGISDWQGEARSVSLERITVLVGIALPVTLLILLFHVRERPDRLQRAGFRAGWRLLLDNAPFRRLVTAYLLNGVANSLPATLFLLFVAHVIQAPEYSGVFLVIYFASGALALPGWLVVSRRFGKQYAWKASMLLVAAVFLAVPFLDVGDIVAFSLICLLSGAGLGADQALPASMQADVIDEDSAAGGGERAGLFFGFWSMATKLALALAVGIAFPVLDLLGFDSTSGAGADVLPWLYAVVPVIFKLTAVYSLSGFALDENRQRALREQCVARARSMICAC